VSIGFNSDPRSAPNFDPLERRVLAIALAGHARSTLAIQIPEQSPRHRPPEHTTRDFVPWRLSDAGRRTACSDWGCPKTSTMHNSGHPRNGTRKKRDRLAAVLSEIRSALLIKQRQQQPSASCATVREDRRLRKAIRVDRLLRWDRGPLSSSQRTARPSRPCSKRARAGAQRPSRLISTCLHA
jgi:hypothetical protein